MGKKWKKEEIEYLQENLGNLSINYISKILNRSQDAIIVKAARLGIGGPTKKTDYLLPNIAGKMIGKDFKVIKYWIDCKGLKITYKVLKNKRRMLIKYEVFIKFLKDNQELWDSRKVEPYALGTEPNWLLLKRKIDRKKPRNSQQKWSKFDEIEAVRMKKEGYSIQEIADKINRSYPSVKRKLYDLRKENLWTNQYKEIETKEM